ncbi:MAG: acyltransferase [Candidatus Gracilibacteria bacterium]|nr:acyltransferase [Candidatus Gracilibacteria bacterium]MDD3119804.1 acyltransferase [Candidatus Gracilibacteria bacterium]MDD4530704.1 acyltransferase [Candidatus Gracilibacteria bacterium]
MNTQVSPQVPEEPKKKRNNFISYLKGIAIIFIMCIHLMDWSYRTFGQGMLYFKEIAFTGVLFFVALAGTVVVIAYKSKPIGRVIKRLSKRFLEIVGIYFLYNLIKYFLFSFQVIDIAKQPFYHKYVEQGTFNLTGILTFQSYTVPLTILVMIASFLLISPIFIYFDQKWKWGKFVNLGLALIFIFIDFWVRPVFNNSTLKCVAYGWDCVLFANLLWLVPYVIGVFIAQIGFDKNKNLLTPIFGILTLIFGYLSFSQGRGFLISQYMYPLELYYVFASFFAMFVFIRIFSFIEKIGASFTQKFLEIIKFLGDDSMAVYIVHWITIDFTYLFLKPTRIIFTVPVVLTIYVIANFNWEKIVKLLKFKGES